MDRSRSDFGDEEEEEEEEEEEDDAAAAVLVKLFLMRLVGPTVPVFRSMTWTPKHSTSIRRIAEYMARADFEAAYAAPPGTGRKEAIEVWLTIMPLDLMSSGKNAWHIWTEPQRLVSRTFLASWTDRSAAVIVSMTAALLTRMSRFGSLLTQLAIDADEVISSAIVSIPAADSCRILETSRAVA